MRRRILLNDISTNNFVDLGLPSGLLWATCNVGASSSEEVGLYFQWGDIVGRTPSDGSSYYTSSAYNSTPGASLTSDIPANETYDAARAILGGAWRMPTKNEFTELINNTIREWTDSFNGTGVKGNIYYKKDSGGNKVSDTFIFLPLTGRMMDYGLNGINSTVNLWASTLYSNTSFGHALYSIQTGNDASAVQYRYTGVPIRAVYKPMQFITITLTGDSVSGITVTVTDSDGIAHSGTTDSNGVVKFTGVVAGSAKISATGYYFTPYSININSSSRTFTIGCEYAVVDLGLPSGLLWAKGNIVSNGKGGYKIGEETDYGGYFSWGNIVPHFSTNGITFDDGYDFGTINDEEPYIYTPGYQLYDNIASDDAQHDAALACLGAPFRLPTKEEFKELYDNTDREWTTINDVKGWRFMKKSEHSIYVFFPAAGSGSGSSLSYRGTNGGYWSASLYSGGNAYRMYFISSSVYPQNNYTRYRGFSVRPVFNP